MTPTLASRSRKQGAFTTYIYNGSFLLSGFLLEYQDAPALPLPESAKSEPKTQLNEMEDFLDDLLS